MYTDMFFLMSLAVCATCVGIAIIILWWCIEDANIVYSLRHHRIKK
jgi:NADH:ubiquinone oxidoreductase subunit K